MVNLIVPSIEAIELEVMQAMADDYVALAKVAPEDIADAMKTLQASKTEAVDKRLAELKIASANAKAQIETSGNTLRDQIAKAFDDTWSKLNGKNLLKAHADLDTTIRQLTYSVAVTRKVDEAGNAVVTIDSPVVSFATKVVAAKRAPGSNGGGSKNPITVDGTLYVSAAEAKRALLPLKHDASMNRGAIISALKTAGHTVNSDLS
jgi:hypothetical protein